MSTSMNTWPISLTRVHVSDWTPNRAARCTYMGWMGLIKRCELNWVPSETPLYPGESCDVLGQDAWALNVALRFQTVAGYWQNYGPASSKAAHFHTTAGLLNLLIQAARKDLAVLEALEALALLYLAGQLDNAAVGQQLHQMGLWP